MQQVEYKQLFPILNISFNKLHLCCPNPQSLVSQDTKNHTSTYLLLHFNVCL